MQRDVSKGTHDWTVLPTAIVSPGHVGATSFCDNSVVAGGWNRVEGAEGALNVTARLTLINKFREHSEADRFALQVHRADRTDVAPRSLLH